MVSELTDPVGLTIASIIDPSTRHLIELVSKDIKLTSQIVENLDYIKVQNNLILNKVKQREEIENTIRTLESQVEKVKNELVQIKIQVKELITLVS